MKTLLVLTTLVIAGNCLLEDILGNIPENKRSVRSIRKTLQIRHNKFLTDRGSLVHVVRENSTTIFPAFIWPFEYPRKVKEVNLGPLYLDLVTRRSYENTLNFLYRIADNNRNGRLSASELAQYTNPKDGKTPLEKARETVRLCDTNNDHELTKTEMLTYLYSVGN